jgi:hypothetical protein
MEDLRFLCGLFPRLQWADATVDVFFGVQLVERVSYESQSEEGGSGPWLGGHGQKSH